MPARQILIADRDPDAVQPLIAHLAALGFDVAGVVASGTAACDFVAATPPTLVLMDVALEGAMDGLAAAECIRQHSHVPIVFMCDASDQATIARLDATQPFRYVMKPASQAELGSRLRAALLDTASTRPAHELDEGFFAISLDLLCCLDFNGYFVRLNPAWENTLGFTRDELMAKPFIEFVHPDDRERTLAQNRAVRAGGQAHSFENRYLCKDGSYRWLRWNATSQESAQIIYSVARDITERKRFEEERDALTVELQVALAEVRSLRAILPICSYCHKIRDEDTWETVETYISRHTNSRFSHGICPTCYARELEPTLGPLG
jgi:PAS domain S-box-containing protein